MPRPAGPGQPGRKTCPADRAEAAERGLRARRAALEAVHRLSVERAARGFRSVVLSSRSRYGQRTSFSDTFPVSLQLGVVAMAIAVIVGVTLGCDCGDPPQPPGRLHRRLLRDRRDLDAFVRRGLAAGPFLRQPVHLVPTGGWNGILSTTIIIPAHCPGALSRCGACPLYPVQHARCAECRLCPNRQGKGGQRERHCPACHPQRHASGDHGRRE